MARVFDKDIFVMMLSIMIGVIIITYFIADIMRNNQITEIEEKHIQEIEEIETKNINFTSKYLDSVVSNEKAKDYLANGKINFGVSKGFYGIILDENNETNFMNFRFYILDNCSGALSNFEKSYKNFLDSIKNFNESIEYSDYNLYIKLCRLYLNLSISGYELAYLSYNLSKYLMYLTENLSFLDGNIVYDENFTALENLYNQTMQDYLEKELEYELRKDIIEIYDLSIPER